MIGRSDIIHFASDRQQNIVIVGSGVFLQLLDGHVLEGGHSIQVQYAISVKLMFLSLH